MSTASPGSSVPVTTGTVPPCACTIESHPGSASCPPTSRQLTGVAPVLRKTRRVTTFSPAVAWSAPVRDTAWKPASPHFTAPQRVEVSVHLMQASPATAVPPTSPSCGHENG